MGQNRRPATAIRYSRPLTPCELKRMRARPRPAAAAIGPPACPLGAARDATHDGATLKRCWLRPASYRRYAGAPHPHAFSRSWRRSASVAKPEPGLRRLRQRERGVQLRPAPPAAPHEAPRPGATRSEERPTRNTVTRGAGRCVTCDLAAAAAMHARARRAGAAVRAAAGSSSINTRQLAPLQAPHSSTHPSNHRTVG